MTRHEYRRNRERPSRRWGLHLLSALGGVALIYLGLTWAIPTFGSVGLIWTIVMVGLEVWNLIG